MTHRTVEGSLDGQQPNEQDAPASPAPPQGEREAFEAWAIKTHGNRALGDPDAGSMWSAWQARAALSASTQPAAPICWAMACSNRLEQPPEWLDRAQPAVSAEALLADLKAMVAEAHDASLDDDHRAARSILTTALARIDAAMDTPPADNKENGNGR